MINWLADKFRIRNSTAQTSGGSEAIIERLRQGQQSHGGIAVDDAVAMKFATVYSCVRLISDTISQMPCHLYRDENGVKTKIDNEPLGRAISVRPTPGLTSFDFWKFFTSQLLLKGYAVAQKIESGREYRLMPIPKITRVERGTTGEYFFHYINSQGATATLAGSKAFWAFYAMDNDLLPVSPITLQKDAIGLGIQAQRHGSKTLGTSATPAGILKSPNRLDAQVKQSIKESWDSTYGPNGSGGIAVLEGGADFAKVAMSNEDAQLLQTRQFQRQEICGIFGVPPHMISDTAQAKGWSTMEQMMTEFVTLTINPLTIRIEQAISMCLIPPAEWGNRYAKFSTTGLMRGDTTARSAYYASGIDKGWLLPAEARAFEELNPMEGGAVNEPGQA